MWAQQYYQVMNPLYIIAACIVAGISFACREMKIRHLARKAANAELDALRFRRQSERLELVLKQCEPELFAQVKARSDMEWQQAVKRLDKGELPILYPLETSITPIGNASGQ